MSNTEAIQQQIDIVESTWNDPELQAVSGKFTNISLQSQQAKDSLTSYIKRAWTESLLDNTTIEELREATLQENSDFILDCVHKWWMENYITDSLEIPEDYAYKNREKAQLLVRNNESFGGRTAMKCGIRQAMEITQIYLNYLEFCVDTLGMSRESAISSLNSPDQKQHYNIFHIFHGRRVYSRTGERPAVHYVIAKHMIEESLEKLTAEGNDPASNKERRSISAYIPLEIRVQRITCLAKQRTLEDVMEGKSAIQAKDDLERKNSEQWYMVRFEAFDTIMEEGTIYYPSDDQERVQENIQDMLEQFSEDGKFMGMAHNENTPEDMLLIGELNYFYVIEGSKEMGRSMEDVLDDSWKEGTPSWNRIHRQYAFRKDLQRWDAEAKSFWNAESGELKAT